MDDQLRRYSTQYMKIAKYTFSCINTAANFAVSHFFDHLQSEFGLTEKKQMRYSTNREVAVILGEWIVPFLHRNSFQEAWKGPRTQLNKSDQGAQELSCQFFFGVTCGVMWALLKIFQCLGHYWGQVGVLFHAHSLTVNLNKCSFLTSTRRLPT